MKMARGLGLFVALALLCTAAGCGKGAAPAASDMGAPADTSVADDAAKEAKPNDQAKQADPPDAGKADAGKQTDAAKADDSAKGSALASGSDKAVSGGSTGSGASTGGNHAKSSTGAASSTAPSAPAKQAPASNGSAGQIALAVTHNFGHDSVFNQTVSYQKGQTLIDVMRGSLDVETAYGGGFVNSINGTKSAYTDKSIFTRKKIDWFYYDNGSVSAVGADAITPHAGDMVWWDYHNWSGEGSNTPCVVGAYPHPFTSGYDGAQPGTVILYSGSHAEQANRLAEGLKAQGASNVRTAAYDNGAVSGASTNVIVLGTWSELGGQSAVQSLFGDPTRTGLYAAFDGSTVTALNYAGKSSGRTGQAAVLATGNTSGDTSPTWLVIGGDSKGLDAAVNLMVNSPGQLRGKMGALIAGGQAVGVPVAE